MCSLNVYRHYHVANVVNWGLICQESDKLEKSWDFSTYEGLRLEDNWETVKAGNEESSSIQTCSPSDTFFFFAWVFQSIVQEMYDAWDTTFIYTHRPWELYKRSYSNRIEEQLPTHVQQRRKMWQLQFSQQTESLDLVSAHLWNHALWTLLWQRKTRFFSPL